MRARLQIRAPLVHHANYFTYFELGRTELLRAAGFDYRRLEELGFYLVVHEITCTYHRPAAFDDLLRLRTTALSAKGARVEHRYEVFRDGDLLAEGRRVVACINRAGRVTRLPDFLLPYTESLAKALPIDVTKVDDS